jgi:hypothetical protein
MAAGEPVREAPSPNRTSFGVSAVTVVRLAAENPTAATINPSRLMSIPVDAG